MVKTPPANAGDAGDVGSIPESESSPWRRKWQPTPVFLPGNSPGQRSLAGYNPWGGKESDTIEQLSTHTHTDIDSSNPYYLFLKLFGVLNS